LLFTHLRVELLFSFNGTIDIVRNEEEADAAVAKLRKDATASKLDLDVKGAGMDMEWHAPRVRGISPSKICLVQICTSAGYCAVFLVAKMGGVPKSLWAILQDGTIRKARCMSSRRRLRVRFYCRNILHYSFLRSKRRDHLT